MGLTLTTLPGQRHVRQRVELQGSNCAFLDFDHVQLGQVVGLDLPGGKIGQPHHHLARRNLFAGNGCDLGHRPGEGRRQLRIAQGGARLLQCGLRRSQVSLGRLHGLGPRARLQQVELRLCAAELRLGSRQIRRPRPVH